MVWANESATEKEYPEGSLFEGPCGPRILRSVSSLNDLVPEERESLERVLEYTDSDEIVGEWQMPVDEVPVGFSGEWLIFGRSEKYVAVNQAGELRQIDVAASALKVDSNAEQQIDYFCSEAVSEAFLGELGESAYLRCWTLKDVSTGALRGAAFQGPCT